MNASCIAVAASRVARLARTGRCERIDGDNISRSLFANTGNNGKASRNSVQLPGQGDANQPAAKLRSIAGGTNMRRMLSITRQLPTAEIGLRTRSPRAFRTIVRR